MPASLSNSNGEPSELNHRERCYECYKPRKFCICERIRPVHNRTPILILQHPRERFHALGTARFARLGLERVDLQVARGPDLRGLTAEMSLPPGAGLLYPAKGARLLTDLAPHERPNRLVVLDGTWHHARRLYVENPWLHALPHYALAPAEPSRYRLRKEPRADFVSTIEAIVLSLRALEPKLQGLDGLISAFDSMIDDQEHYAKKQPAGPRERRTRPKSWRTIPRCLVEDYDKLVVVSGESRSDLPGKKLGRELLVWFAERPASGERFQCHLKPRIMPTKRHLEHLALEGITLEQGKTPVEFLALWEQFLGTGATVAAWNQSTLDLLQQLGWSGKVVLLKSVYCNVHKGRHGGGNLDQILNREEIEPEPNGLPGRAGTRLANAVAIASHLRGQTVRPAGS